MTDQMKNHAEDFDNDGKTLADRGLDAAILYLERRGFDVIEREWRCADDTVDVIAIENGTIVFVGVKVRTAGALGFPDECAKEMKPFFEKVAAAYLAETDYVDCPVRFDVVSVLVISSSRALIRHHVNALV